MQPYRCSACSRRFLAPGTSWRRWLQWASGTGVTVVAAALVFVALLKDSEHLDPSAITQLQSADQSVALTSEILSAAEQGDPAAQYRVARNLLFAAMSDKRKSGEALEWLQRAAQNGSTAAMVQLGRMHRSGIGALQDYSLSGQWIERAAAAGDVDGMLELGRLYRDGIGFEHNPILAYAWFNRAAAELSTEAALERDSLARRLSAEQLGAAQSLSATLHSQNAAIGPGGALAH